MAVPPVSSQLQALLARQGAAVAPLVPLGAAVTGLDLRQRPPEELRKALEVEMASRGFLVFKGQGVLSGSEQVECSAFWGGQELHSTHGVHEKALNRHIFRLSNRSEEGIVGVGPQWHNDGSFEESVFSHVGYHIVRVPEKGGDTEFVHQGAAYDALEEETKSYWARLISVNATSGVLHPMVHEHPISKRRSVYLHLGMTGGILEQTASGLRLLEEEELLKVFNDYNELLNRGLSKNGGAYGLSYAYEEGDCIFIDNWAIAHRATPEAHLAEQGLRILHRTTVRSPWPGPRCSAFAAFATPQLLAKADVSGQGVFVAGGLGFRWAKDIRMQN